MMFKWGAYIWAANTAGWVVMAGVTGLFECVVVAVGCFIAWMGNIYFMEREDE